MQIQLLGIPTDSNSSYRRGPASAPAAIRQAWRRYAEFGNAATESGLEIGSELTLVDLGDVAIREAAPDHAVIAAAASQAARAGRCCRWAVITR